MPNNGQQNDLSQGNISEMLQKNSEALHIPRDTYVKIVTASINECTLDLPILEEAISEGSFDSIGPIAHKLKGVFGNLKLTSLETPAIEIDSLAKNKRGIEEIKENFIQFKKAFEKIKEKL